MVVGIIAGLAIY